MPLNLHTPTPAKVHMCAHTHFFSQLCAHTDTKIPRSPWLGLLSFLCPHTLPGWFLNFRHPPHSILTPSPLPRPTSIQVSTGPQLRLLSTSPDRVSRYCSSSGTSIWRQGVKVGLCEWIMREPTALPQKPSSSLGRPEIQLDVWVLKHCYVDW
jgi:hypothetical protein